MTAEPQTKPKAAFPVVISLLSIGIASLVLRLAFLHVDLPLNSDNFLYFIYAIDSSLGVQSQEYMVRNDGWPTFLSFFFSIFQSNNFMDYMALQRYVSIAISVLTIVPVYFLCKKFAGSSIAVIGAAVFVLEPRIVQNSLFGITEPLYIMMLTTSLAMFFSSRERLIYACFAILALSVTVRIEGVFLYPAFVGMFLYRYRISRNSLVRFGILTAIFVLILFATGMLNDQSTGLLSRVGEGSSEITSSPETARTGGSAQLIASGLTNMAKFLAWSMIPYLVIFVPFGFVLLVKKRTAEDKMLLIASAFILLPTIFAYSFAADSRYLFPLYPVFAVMACYSIAYFHKKVSLRVLGIALVASMVTLSAGFLIWKDIDYDHEMETWALASQISDMVSVVNIHYPESAYLTVVGITKADSFPIPSDEFRKMGPTVLEVRKAKSLSEILQADKEKRLTHLVLYETNSPAFLDDVFYNESEYPYLVKIFDSRERGYKQHVKIFEIDYDSYNALAAR